MNKNDHKIQNIEHFPKTVLYVKQLANAHRSTKFQIGTCRFFTPKSLIHFYNMTPNSDEKNTFQ